MEAGEAGADYVAFGAFYQTTTKPSALPARPVDPQLVVERCSKSPASRSAGSRPANAAPLVDAGADFLAVCQAVWGKDDPAAAVAAFEEVLSL